MCGEIDENVQINQEILERFTVMSRMLGIVPPETPGKGPSDLAEAEGRATYMNQLFQAGLTRSLTDATQAEDDEAVDAIASQAIAFARLAGFLAAQLPPDADLFRAVIEAMTAGHGESGKLERKYHDDQAKRYGHSHDHDHNHDHHHH